MQQANTTTSKWKRASNDVAAELARHISAILNNPGFGRSIGLTQVIIRRL